MTVELTMNLVSLATVTLAVLVGIGTVLGIASAALHFVAPRTKTTVDDRIAAGVDWLRHLDDDGVAALRVVLAQVSAGISASPQVSAGISASPIATSSRRTPQSGRARVTVICLLAAIGVSVVLAAAGCASPAVPADLGCPATVPASLAPPADQDLSFALSAWGVQRYTCTPSGWTLVAPDADLFARGVPARVVHHFGGLTWLANDTSLVVGAKVASETVDATAIPWLLLSVAAHGGAAGGLLSPISSIHRLDTGGGLAPDAPCDAAHIGQGFDSPYRARYFFYSTSAHPTHRCK